jgi:N-acetylglucosaminyldiphosphoundecaprenol N-acetyl-beta-D-mannosaminyltransferase
MLTDRKLLFGVHFDAIRMDDVTRRARVAIETRRRLLIGVLNAAKIVNMRRDPLLRDSLMECDLMLADGQSVVWASRLLRRPLPERVAGVDIFESLLDLAHRNDHSVFLLGARPEVLRTVETRLRERFPGLRIAGSYHGYFDAEEAPQVAARIRQSGADMLFLGITSPKKEIFLGAFGRSLDVPVLHGVGGAFDIVAGLTRRAPPSWQRLGMEWAYRVLQEPGRLWWRYLSTNTVFVLLILKELARPSRAFETRRAGGSLKTIHHF